MLYDIAKPLLFALPPETAHDLTLACLSKGLLPAAKQTVRDDLSVEIAGLTFPNPVGLAAGFDKAATAIDSLLGFGFGFVEVGTVTPEPQTGNPKPRLFRLAQDGAVINRFGFNNPGHKAFVDNLNRRKATGIVGGNIGANKTSSDPVGDYVKGVLAIGPHVDYLTINISSPNTPGLRDLQGEKHLKTLLAAAMPMRERVQDHQSRRLPVFLKLAPDMAGDDLKSAADISIEAGIDALIISNTTITRPDGLQSKHRAESGGLSGRPLHTLSRECLIQLKAHVKDHIPLISVGGISSVEDVADRLALGASLIQIYSVLVYQGPYVVSDWVKRLPPRAAITV